MGKKKEKKKKVVEEVVEETGKFIFVVTSIIIELIFNPLGHRV